MLFGKHVNKYYLKYWYLYLIGIASLFFVDYVNSVIPPRLIKNIMDGLTNGTLTNPELNQYILKFVMVAFVALVTRFLWRIGFFGVGYRMATDMRHELFKKSLRLSQTFYSDNKVGGLMSYYINDMDAVQECFGWGAMMLCDVLFLVPMLMTEMFKVNWKIAIVCIIPCLIILVMSLILEKYMEERYQRRQDRFEDLSDFTQENFSGIRVIKAFVRESKELLEFNKRNKDCENANMRHMKFSVTYNFLLDVFIWSIYLGIIVIGSYIALSPDGALSIGELTQLTMYFDNLLWPMFAISEIINMVSSGKASLNRLNIILDAKEDLIEKENPLPLKNFSGNIKFNHLSFKYPDSKELFALNDLTFEIKSGEFIGIIGRTGTSKTTLVNLLLRLYNVNEGELFFDGEDIMNYSIKDIRDSIGYVPQDNFLYSTTIESNIAFSESKIDKEKVVKEASIAGVHKDIIDFPKGYETVLGERGVSVSGGQKQRISIARALYKNPSVLILDDSLSAVDTKTESEILEYLKSERKGRTTILVAHRISSIKDADKILVLDTGGRLSGFGSHKELIETNEIYKEIYNLQKLDSEEVIE